MIYSRTDRDRFFRIIQTVNRIEGVVLVNQALHINDNNGVTHERKFSAKDFDHSGWYCPLCGHKGSPIFVKCGTCQECVCGSRVKRVSDDKSSFACHDFCSGTGLLDGEITDYTGKPNLPTSPKIPASSASNQTKKDTDKSDNPLLNNKTESQLGNDDIFRLGYNG